MVDEPFTLEDPNPASMDEFSPSRDSSPTDDDGQMEVIQSSEGCCTPGELHRIHTWDAESSSWTRRPDLEETIYPDKLRLWVCSMLTVMGWSTSSSPTLRCPPTRLGQREFTERTLDMRDYTNETAGLVPVDLTGMVC